MKVARPDNLKPGDKVGVVAPARKINPADVTFASKILASWGVEILIAKNIFSAQHSYLSGNDGERLQDLQLMIDDPDIRAIICARGGYGSTRILDSLDFSSLQKNPKWIIGFSDITALHLKLVKHGVASIHGTMPILFSKEDASTSIESLRELLMDGVCKIQAASTDQNKTGTAKGLVIGGNLSLIVDSLGTATAPDTDGKILFVEEIDEYLYKIDRMMTQLKRAGKLNNLSGLIVGHMTDIKDTELSFGQTVEDIILDAVKDHSYPVAFGFPSGHEHPNYAWIHGGQATLSVNDAGTFLTF
jgi:muramoyltetrapeptide carboxypeptidase